MKKVIIDGIEYVPVNSIKSIKEQIVDKHVHFELYPEDSPKKMTWDEAVEYCKSLGEGWRLPTIGEMFYIYENKFITEDYYWSSTEYYYDYAWYFYFNDGNAYNYIKGSTFYVRAIKDIKQ